MKLKFLNKNNEEKTEKIKKEKPVKLPDEKKESTNAEKKIFQIPGLRQFNALMKLRIIVSIIFILCTISMILIFLNSWVIAAILLLLGYFMLLLLTIKLFMIKNI